MTDQEQFEQLLAAQKPIPADAILLFAGDGMNRIPYTAQLYAERYAPVVVMVSADRRYEYGSAPARELAAELEKVGVPQSALLVEEVAHNTKEEAERFLTLAREHGWRSVLLVTSPHHAPRVLLTMLRALAGAPTRLIPATALLAHLGPRSELEAQERERIEQYQQKGDVASYREGIDYLHQWKS